MDEILGIFVDVINKFLNKDCDTPIYMQIVYSIKSLIQNDVIPFDSKLPTVRDLSKNLSLSIGTIRHAYIELENLGLIKTIQGKGTFLTNNNHQENPINRTTQASVAIETMLDKLIDLGFSYNEIQILVELHVKKYQKKSISLAIVDCNPEAITVIQHQLKDTQNINITSFLLESVQMSPFKLMDNYDIIVTTHNHYDSLVDLLRPDTSKITKVVMTTRESTIVELTSIKENMTVGIWCESERYAKIIKDGLKRYTSHNGKIITKLSNEVFNYSNFLNEVDILIVSPNHENFTPEEFFKLISNCNSKKVIVYTYQTDRGSLLFLKERIESVQNNIIERSE